MYNQTKYYYELSELLAPASYDVELLYSRNSSSPRPSILSFNKHNTHTHTHSFVRKYTLF